MPASDIVIRGAREHNLRGVDLVLPRNTLICMTGVSGSGKSSLAFDTVYAEGQRRYVESLSSFARQFLGNMPKPDVDMIAGLSPSISISQKSAGNNPRSTVGTMTEIYDYLRVLFARVGDGFCPGCQTKITTQTRESIIEQVMRRPEGEKAVLLAPLIRGQKGEYRDLFTDLLKQGFVRARVDGAIYRLTDELNLDRQMRHDIEVVIDRVTIKPDQRGRIAEAVELALKHGKGTLIAARGEADETKSDTGANSKSASGRGKGGSARRRTGRGSRTARGAGGRPGDTVFSVDYSCGKCGRSFQPPSPQLFSFNSPQGMCPECDGLGDLFTFDAALLIPDESKSLNEGAVETIGPWKDLGRWRRHIYQGVAETMERLWELPEGHLLETPWRNLTEEQQEMWLYGTGGKHITYTWRGGASPMKYGGTYDGIIPELLDKYRNTKSKLHLKKLEGFMNTVRCPGCGGQRLNEQARNVKITTAAERFGDLSLSLPEVCELSVTEAEDFFSAVALDDIRATIAAEALKEIRGRLGFLMNVGLDYLTLSRTAPTLSGGESHRIRLAGQIGCGLVGVLYILDEPSIGLHPRDNERLLGTLARLRDQGNTVIVVEHDEDTMRAADHIIDFGPGPGIRGGEVVAEGDIAEVARAQRSVTARFLTGERQIAIPATRRGPGEKQLVVRGARHNNLKNIDVEIPLGRFVCVTGVSGSGKSSLVSDILVEALRRDLNRGDGYPGAHDRIEGLEHLDKLIAIDQSPIGRTPRSNPGTYIKVFDDIRHLFAQLPEAKRRGYKAGRFSFNVEGGRCEACDGNGANKLEMDFLADIWVTCPVCEGHRYNRETRQALFKGKSISEVLEMDIQQLLDLFENQPRIKDKLQTLHDVGLDYLKLGQPSPTLSGGEAQRIKLARELVKRSTGQTLYLLDEPTTGLHFADIEMLLRVLHNFVQAGNTVLVVEHNMDVIKTADWIIDMGPEGGAAGGEIVTAGTPEEVAANERSYTGQVLREVLAGGRAAAAHRNGAATTKRSASKSRRVKKRVAELAKRIEVRGARQHNLKNIDVSIDRDRTTVFCGMSGSGKTSLAMDTIYAEGQRRYVESLSSYARQFVSQMQKPAVEHVEGLSPAIAIEQRNLGHTPRSTVGTVTEIYDYFRVLLARLGQPYCPDCDVPIGTQTSDDIVDKLMRTGDGAGDRLFIAAPIDIEVGQRWENKWTELRKAGFARVRIDGVIYNLEDAPAIDRRRKHDVQVIVDRLTIRPDQLSRVNDAVETALGLGAGVLFAVTPRDDAPEERWPGKRHSQHLACERCDRSFERLSPHHFSFNSSLGWCPACEGLGTQIGANPAALIRDSRLSLREGALAIWPDVAQPIAIRMLEALSRSAGVPIDEPLEELSPRQRRTVLHGAGEQWFDVYATADPDTRKAPLFRFQYKGLYPALEEASRLSPSLRARLESLVDEVECTTCGGDRLRDDAAAMRLFGKTLGAIGRMPLNELMRFVEDWKLDKRGKRIAGELVREIGSRTRFLLDVGLEYLTLGRSAPTLSAGESQRIRLASQLGSGLTGVLYVLDEPTIGLHPRDNRRLIQALSRLRDLGNTLLVVEHDREVIGGADAVVDFGPAAGAKGGRIVAQGTPKQLARRVASITGPYLSGKKSIAIPSNRRLAPHRDAPQRAKRKSKKTAVKGRKTRTNAETTNEFGVRTDVAGIDRKKTDWLAVIGARHNNLKDVSIEIPLGAFTCVTGPSGSGKSSLIEDVLYAALARRLHRASLPLAEHDEIRGIQHVNKVIRVDQQPIGNSPTSNPATYTGAFDLIRQLYAQLPESKLRGFAQRRFSFNVAGGRCEACEGAGQKRIEMHFLPDVWIECETCRGARYNPETLAVKYRGRTISDVLEMSCEEGLALFENIPRIRRVLSTLCDVGLEYLALGQPANTLSGGEAQRVKLAAELSRPDTGRTLYLLDEPTTGLHFEDLQKLLTVLHRLVDLGNTVVVIEHNLDLVKSADWIIDLGPDAGEAGGRLVTCGSPEQVATYAAQWLKETLGQAALQQVSNGDVITAGSAKKKSTRRKKKTAPPAGLRSHTGEALLPLLVGGAYQQRRLYDPYEAEKKRRGDVELEDVGKQIQMPWEEDGRLWHTQTRVDRRGEPVQWDGRMLGKLIDRIHQLGKFSDTNWDHRSVVEIAAEKKSVGWFFHAITAETWLLKLKFRTAKSTFKRDNLVADLGLRPLNQIDELPVYGNEPRVKVKNLRGPWQEIEIRAHQPEELETPAFDKFLIKSVKGFEELAGRIDARPLEVAPWKQLGRKWHFSRKGFPIGKKIRWDQELLEELCDILEDVSDGGEFLWHNQVLIHRMLPGRREPWVTVVTKNPAALRLDLRTPPGAFGLGRIADLGAARQVDGARDGYDLIQIMFRSAEDLQRGDLKVFLMEHRDAVMVAAAT